MENGDYRHLHMPQSHRFTSRIAINDVMHGLLHMYVRHHVDFEYLVPGLQSQRLMLPKKMQIKLHCISKASNIGHALSDVEEFKRLFGSSASARRTLYRVQIMLLQYLETAVTTMPSTTTTNTANRFQLRLQLKNGRKLVIGMSNIKNSVASFDDNRRVRYVRTAYLF
uniref:PB1 domain-containing protein n=1 Tax=Panagrellus redivivus TaxID=6233 RepID=A0A7E4UMX2_PANRE